jgi:hypothetical protein
MMVVGRARREGEYGLRPAAFALPLMAEGMRAGNAEVDAAELAEWAESLPAAPAGGGGGGGGGEL